MSSMKYVALESLQQIEDEWGLDMPETTEDRIKFLKREFGFLNIYLRLQSFTDLRDILDVIHKVQDNVVDLKKAKKMKHIDRFTSKLQDEIGETKLEIRVEYSFPKVSAIKDPKFVIEFIDAVVGSLGDLLKIYGRTSLLYVPGPKKELGDVFKELKLLRNFVCFVSDRCAEPLNQHTNFFTHVLAVAGHAAMVAWLYLPSNAKDNRELAPDEMTGLLSDLLLTKIKPIQPGIREIYIDALNALRLTGQSPTQWPHVDDCVAGFVETLQHNLKELPTFNDSGSVVASTDKIAALQDMLNLLISKLIPLSIQDFKFHLQDINTVMIDSGLLVYSLYEDVALVKVTFDLSDTIQRIKTVIYHIIRKEFQSNLPMIHGLGFIDFLLNNLKEFQERYPDSLAFVKTQLQMIQKELESSQPFIRSVAEERHNNRAKLQHSVALLVGKAYEVEYIIDACITKYIPDWCLMLWILDLIEEIGAEVAAIQVLEVDLVSHATMATDVSHAPSALARTQMIDEVMVGFEDEIKILLGRLIGRGKDLDVISIVGMPGVGKTTLANRLYFNISVQSHFDIHAYVSSVYSKRELLLSILATLPVSIENITLLSQDTYDLELTLHRYLLGRRYLILIDDVWDSVVWGDLIRCFPDNHTGSRILLTTRREDVADYAKSTSEPLHLRLLSNQESWELLKRKVFGVESCSPLLEKIGQEIARKCRGLPSSIILLAGVLAKMEKTEKCWRQVAEDSDAITLEHVYQHLPYHLKPCFLYFGTFLEDREINVSKLTWLWIGEGFVKDCEHGSLQDTAEGYLEDLIRRTLLMDARRSSDDKVKTCRIHDLLLNFCRKRAEEEHLLLWIKRDQKAYPSSGICSNKQLVQRRLAFFEVDNIVDWSSSCSLVGSVLYREDTSKYGSCRQVSPIFHNFKFLKVLDLESIVIYSFPTMLVYLRYFAAQTTQESITSLVANLWNLETLILKPTKGKLRLPITVWKMVKLRNLCIDSVYFALNGAKELIENLEVLSAPCFSCAEDVELLLRKTPNLRELRCSFVDFGCELFPKLDVLSWLETLEIHLATDSMVVDPYFFPSSLRNLTLSNFFLGSCHKSNISMLPNLQVLKLVSIFFDEDEWKVSDGEFVKLKVLKLVSCEFFEEWEVSDDAFPCLEHLVLRECPYLKAIPIGFESILSLKSIKVKSCNESVDRSAMEIKGVQVEDYGNSDCKVFIQKVKRDQLSDMKNNKWEAKKGVAEAKEEEEEDDNVEEDNKRKKISGAGPTLPSCQVEQCTADLADAKEYYRRHRVCNFHSKAPVVLISGLHQRFCQQCSRFHQLPEFDEAKRSCRRRLLGHYRRRKISYDYNDDNNNPVSHSVGSGEGRCTQTLPLPSGREAVSVTPRLNKCKISYDSHGKSSS